LVISDQWSLVEGSVVEPRWSAVDSEGVEQTTSTEIYHSDDDIQ